MQNLYVFTCKNVKPDFLNWQQYMIWKHQRNPTKGCLRVWRVTKRLSKRTNFYRKSSLYSKKQPKQHRHPVTPKIDLKKSMNWAPWRFASRRTKHSTQNSQRPQWISANPWCFWRSSIVASSKYFLHPLAITLLTIISKQVDKET